MATGETIKDGDRQTPKSNGQFSYSLNYNQKKAETEILKQTKSSKLAKLWSGGLINIEELGSLYIGDNLNVLAALHKNAMIKGKVKLVYIDPPFATNQQFVSRNRTAAYQDLLTGWHYIEFMRERLIFLKELLSEDGSIYVHIDDNMAFEMKLIMDEIFGRKNFRNFIVRKKSNPKNYTHKQFGNVADYIFFYSKTDKYIWNRPYSSWDPLVAEKEYPYIEATSGRRYKKVPIHAPGTRNGDTGKSWKGLEPPPGKHWQYKRSTLDELDEKGEIYWSANGNPRRKIYFDVNNGIPIQDIWMDLRDAHNQNIKITGYPTEKNPKLLERIVLASSNPGDLVLDCFSGSGTTVGVAASLGRRWIGVDNSEESLQATLTRFIHGLQPMGDFVTKQQEQTVMFEDNEIQKYLETMSIYKDMNAPISVSTITQLARLNRFGKLSKELASNVERIKTTKL